MLQMALVKMQKWKNKEKICYIGEFLVTTTGSTLSIGKKTNQQGSTGANGAQHIATRPQMLTSGPDIGVSRPKQMQNHILV